jgi:hypothetical protein
MNKTFNVLLTFSIFDISIAPTFVILLPLMSRILKLLELLISLTIKAISLSSILHLNNIRLMMF